MYINYDIIRAMNKQLHFTPEDGLLREPDAKKIAPNLFEIRVKVTRMQYRLFYCYVDSNGIWVLSGFIKKTQKTPQKEIHNAIKIRKEVEG